MPPYDSTTAKLRNAKHESVLSQRNLRTLKFVGDGNCLFMAISLQMFSIENNHSSISHKTANMLEQRKCQLF